MVLSNNIRKSKLKKRNSNSNKSKLLQGRKYIVRPDLKGGSSRESSSSLSDEDRKKFIEQIVKKISNLDSFKTKET